MAVVTERPADTHSFVKSEVHTAAAANDWLQAGFAVLTHKANELE